MAQNENNITIKSALIVLKFKIIYTDRLKSIKMLFPMAKHMHSPHIRVWSLVMGF